MMRLGKFTPIAQIEDKSTPGVSQVIIIKKKKKNIAKLITNLAKISDRDFFEDKLPTTWTFLFLDVPLPLESR